MEISNNLTSIADSYIQLAKRLNVNRNLSEYENLNILLFRLPDLKLDSNYVLDDFSSLRSTNSVLFLYARPKSLPRPSEAEFDMSTRVRNKKYAWVIARIKDDTSFLRNDNSPSLVYPKKIWSEDSFKHIAVPFTEEGVWQAYLLRQTYHLTGMSWHGYYEMRTFVNSYKDIENVGEPVLDHDHQNLESLREAIRKQWTAEQQPKVTLDRDCAHITHYWFDPWQGYMKVQYKAVFDARRKRIVKFEKEEEMVVLEFHCGVKF